MPEKTLAAFADHGRGNRPLAIDGGDAEAVLGITITFAAKQPGAEMHLPPRGRSPAASASSSSRT